MDTNLFAIKFSGPDINPNTIRIGELSGLLNNIEDIISSTIIRKHPKLTKDQILLGLVDIESGSTLLKFSSELSELVEPAIDEFALAIETKEYSSLPYEAYEPLTEFTKFIKKRNCEAHFITLNGHETTKFVLTPDIELSFPGLISGETTIYGRIVRVGGKEPKVAFEPFSGNTIYCNVKEELAKKLAEYLYTDIALTGIAKWNPKTFDLCKFKIVSFHEFKSGSFVSAFSKLSKVIGKYFNETDDLNGYISNIRREQGKI